MQKIAIFKFYNNLNNNALRFLKIGSYGLQHHLQRFESARYLTSLSI